MSQHSPQQSSYWTMVSPSDEHEGKQRPLILPGLPEEAWPTPDTMPRPPKRPYHRRRGLSTWQTALALCFVVLLAVLGTVSGYSVSTGMRPKGQVRSTPMAPATAPMTASPIPSPPAGVLEQDTFARPNQRFWGMASSGAVWGADANNSPAFSIVGSKGQIVGDGQGFYTAILGPTMSNEEVVLTNSISAFNQQRNNVGAVLRWTDNDNYYKAYLDGTSLIVMKKVAGMATRLGTVPFTARDATSYTIRFRALNMSLSVRAWPTGMTEPATWTVMVSDSALQTGFGGVRVLAQPGAVVTVTAFSERGSG